MMKNSVSEQSFYIESEDEEEVEVSGRADGDDDGEEAGNGSDSSNYCSDNDDDDDDGNREQSKPNSLNPSWPQSYRLLSIFVFVCVQRESVDV